MMNRKGSCSMSIRLYVIALFVLASSLAFNSCKDIGTQSQNVSLFQLENLIAVNGNRRVTLYWSNAINGTAVEFEVHRGSEQTFTASPYTRITTLPASVRTYMDSSVSNGRTYYYRIVPIEIIAGRVRVAGISEASTMARPFDYSPVTRISFSEHIQPIFQSGCAVHGCHVGQSPGKFGQQLSLGKTAHDEKFSLREWMDIFAGGDHGAIVIPFKASKSHVVFHMNVDSLLAPISTPHMPPFAGANIPADQLRLIMRWIDEGAQDDDGNIALSTYPQGKVLITNQAEDLVTVVDVASNLVARYIQAGVANVFIQPPHAPHNVTVDIAHGYYYVNLVASGEVLKYRLSDNVRVGEVSGLISPTQVALSGSGDTAYVAQFASGVNAIRVLDTRTMQVIGQFSSTYLDKPHGVQVTPDGKELWITGNLSDNILVVNLQDNSTSLIQLDGQAPGIGGNLLPYQTVMTSDNRFVYVSCQRSNEVRVISRSSMNVVKSIPVGVFPLIPAISPDDRFVYVPNRNSNSLSVISTLTDSVVATIANVGPQPHGIAITNDGRFAYVSCENVAATVPPHHPTSGSKTPGYVSIIDLQSNTVIKQFEVGAFAAGIAIVQ